MHHEPRQGAKEVEKAVDLQRKLFAKQRKDAGLETKEDDYLKDGGLYQVLLQKFRYFISKKDRKMALAVRDTIEKSRQESTGMAKEDDLV